MQFSVKISGLLLACSLAGFTAQAQNTPELSQTVTPGGTTNPGVTPPPFGTNSGLFNYVRTYTPKIPMTDAAGIGTITDPNEVQLSTVFKDGFNRPIQSIQRHFTAAGHLVTPMDTRFQKGAYGFLPYTIAGDGFRNQAFSEQLNFYGSRYPNDATHAYSYSRNSSDAANRKADSYAPGKSQAGQGRATTVKQGINTANQVRIWDLDANGLPVTPGYYPAGVLFSETATNSEGAEATSFKDKDGRVVCKTLLQKVTFSGPNALAEYGTTYYVYDEQGNMRYILPPKASNLVSGGTLSQAVLDGLCFQYRYDDKGRKIAQRVPGKNGWEEFIYDKKNRLVFYRDPNLTANSKWTFTVYDALDRVLMSGIYTGVEDRATIQNSLDDPNAYTPATIVYYQKNYALMATYPSGTWGCEALVYNYYDDYQLADPSGTLWNTYANELAFTEIQTGLPGAETPVRSTRTIGKLTGSKVKMTPAPNANPAKTGEWTESTFYYDDKGRMIYTVSKDLYQGNPVHIHYSGSQYDFMGRVLNAKHVLVNANSTDGVYGHKEVTRNSYDNLTGRLTQTQHKVNAGPWTITGIYGYDELGRSKTNVLGNYGEVQTFDYNIRGQLTGINAVYAETGDRQGESRSFGESLKYDFGFSQPRYDGKIAGMVWRGAGTSPAMAYGYSYDHGGRLTAADYRRLEPPSGSYLTPAWRNDIVDFSVGNLGYDLNGNITGMKQRGMNLNGQPDDIDQLSYNYFGSSNQLQYVSDAVTVDNGRGDFQDGNTGTNDYQYDPNGNLKLDKNKGIGTVSYTYLNKPERIAFNNGGYIENSYDAAGGKVQELLYNPADNSTKRTDYLGNFVYKNDSLQYILTGNGRTVYNPANQTFREEFFVKDHLGNVRSVIDVYTYATQEYFASYEIASANLENLFFEKIDEVRDDKPGSTWNGDLKSARLNGADATRVTGTSALLKVMAGDKVEMNVNNYFENYDPDQDTPLQPEDLLASIISTLTGGQGGTLPGENHDTKLVDRTFTSGNYSVFDQIVQNNTDPSKPRASLNYILFDENMQIIPGSSGLFQANGNGTWTTIGTTTPLVMPVNGYLAVYLNNASRVTGCLSCSDVFFDQLVLRFTRGNLKEEAHYYPHGLPIAGMGSAAHGFVENRRKYQGNEYIKDLGLNWMDFQARQYDPQLGRFLAVDPLADAEGQDMTSPYTAMGNAPESMVDPDGTFAFLAPEMVNTAMEVFGSSNISVSGGGMVSFINLDAAILSFKAIVASGKLPSGAALSTSLYNALSSVLAFHNSSSVNARISLANNGEVETEWSLSLAETEINGDGSGNTIYSSGIIAHQQFAPANSGGCMTVPNEFVHATLETFGYIPGIGEVFDGLNAISYAFEGDFANAGLSLAAGVPVIGYLANGAKWGKRAANAGENLWKVGHYADLKGIEAGLDAHHVGQGALMKRLVAGYNYKNAPAILVPAVGHTKGPGVVSRATKGFTNARQVLARDIMELRRVYPDIPNSALRNLIDMNKTMYPKAFIK
jgi:RHS repeat-associated protein